MRLLKDVGKVVLPGFACTHNHVGYTFYSCEEGIALNSAA